MPHLKDHVVVCNWNARSNSLVRALHSDLLGRCEDNWFPIVVLSEHCESFPDEGCFEDTFYIPGSPLSEAMLKRANLEDATTAIIVSDDNAANPDDHTLMIALRLRSYLQKAGVDHVRVVAEVMEPENAASFRRTTVTGLHEVVCEREIDLRTLAQTGISAGLTIVLQQLLEYTEGTSEVYTVPIPDSWASADGSVESIQSIYDLVLSARGGIPLLPGVILLGIARPRASGEVSFLICPSPKRLKESGVSGLMKGDRLIVLARGPEDAQSATGVPLLSN